MCPLVLALNPAVDVEWRVPSVVWEEKNNILSERRWAGGKGVNVTRWLIRLGSHPTLLIPLGGENGVELARHLRQETISFLSLPLRENTRANIIVTTLARRQLRLNPIGPRVSRQEWRLILARVAQRMTRQGCLILSGSLPRGLSAMAYRKLIQLAAQHEVKAIVDCDGAPFAHAIKARPFLVKPNEHELALWWGRPFDGEIDVWNALEALALETQGWVLLSRGSQGGILINSIERGCYVGTVPRLKTLNTIGAGDALLAAVARQIELGREPVDWLRWGLAAGSAATQVPAGRLPSRARINEFARRVRITNRCWPPKGASVRPW
jgi:1-phosphofructokinase family hexose kinase